jgi:hypothetical protein
MADLIFVLIVIVFFALSAVLIKGIEKIKG